MAEETKPKVIIDATFHMQKAPKVSEEEKDPKYKEYRRKWNENPKNHIVGDFPIHLDIESTSSCNLKCVMCFQNFNPPPKGYIDFELYKRIIDEGSQKGLCSVKLSIRGEPLLHPRIVDLVKYAKDKGVVEVMFNTNGNLLKEELSKRLIKAGLDKIIFSIDGITKEFYESIRIGGNFDRVLGNVKTLRRLKREMGTEKPYIRIQMVKLKKIKNIDEHVKKYVEFWSRYADYVAAEEENEWDYSKNTGTVVDSTFDCPMVYQRLMVRYDGTTTMCCGDLYAEMPIGNAKADKLGDMWKGEKINNVRKMNAQGKSHLVPICNKCGYRRTVINNSKKDNSQKENKNV